MGLNQYGSGKRALLQSWTKENGTANPHPPQIKDEVARRVKTRHLPILDLGGRGGGGLGFPFILSKIVGFSQRNRILCREDKFFNS